MVLPETPLSLSVVPDEVLLTILQAHADRCHVRAVAQRCRRVVEDHFQIRRVQPPEGEIFCIDFEVDQYMTKHLYCAQFGGASAGDAGGVAGRVTFINWVPAYWRGSSHGSRDIRHRLPESDACALWKLVTKVRDQRSVSTSAQDATPMAASVGFLTVSEGGGGDHSGCGNECKREVIGRLSPMETELVLSVLDYRKNEAAMPVMAA
mmetsp:Transcript_25011/g.56726  ORF Transcript_25011/g.56726 Transcript_25011/m.56726 type:complete len:207 (-) Transcript_25011:72-692(-)